MDLYAGSPNYDITLGQTALANGQPNLAIFAFERIVLSQPEEYNARLLLGRAYINAGELTQAKQELNFILKHSNNHRLLKHSRNLLSLINSVKSTSTSKLIAYLNIGFGHDSNANNATSEEEFLGFRLNEKSKQQASTLSSQTLIGQFQYAINRTYRFHSSIKSFNYQYQNADFVNTQGLALSNSISINSNKRNQKYFSVNYQTIRVDSAFNNQRIGGKFLIKHIINKRNSMSTSLQVSQTNYSNAYKIRDFQSINIGLQYKNAFKLNNEYFAIRSLSFITGKDKSITRTSNYDRQYLGMMMGSKFESRKYKSSIGINYSYLYSDYAKPFFSKKRTDQSHTFAAEFSLKFNKNWNMGSNFRVMRTRSPINLFKYDKIQFTFLVSRRIV